MSYEPTKNRSTLKLRVNALGRGQFWLDDVEISRSVTGVELKTDVNDVNRVTITFIAVNFDVEAEVDEKRSIDG